jgi:hypothetical protein
MVKSGGITIVTGSTLDVDETMVLCVTQRACTATV